MRFILSLIFFAGLSEPLSYVAEKVFGYAGTTRAKIRGLISKHTKPRATSLWLSSVNLITLYLNPNIPGPDEPDSLEVALDGENTLGLVALLDASEQNTVPATYEPGQVYAFRTWADGQGYPGDALGDRLANLLEWTANNATGPA